MQPGKSQSRMLPLLVTLSLLMTPSCALRDTQVVSPSQVVLSILKGESSQHISETERLEIQQVIRESYPKFPYPTREAIQAIRQANDPALNLWVQHLTVLCRQLNPDCND